jgi:hypothetical protein
VQTPPQALLAHTYWQFVAVPQVPDVVHVCTCVVPMHCVVPGVQLPTQAPFTQA